VATRGIYCIENWSGRRANRNSVRPVLEFLGTSGVARFIHERVSTLGELEHRLDDWADRKQYPLCYLALHGSPESVHVGRHELRLEDLLLIDQGDERPIDLKGKTLFLASCSTLASDRRWLRKVASDSKLNTLCGYGRDVEWFEAAAFDLLVLAAMCEYARASDAIKYLRREHGGFVKRMRFSSEPNWTPK
jgi:hypothetical protein